MFHTSRGFTFTEVMVSISIIVLLSSIGMYSFRDTARNKEIITITDAISATLEKARSNAITGKNGNNYGLKFDNDRFTYFVGTSFIQSSDSNEVTVLPNYITIANNIPGSDDKIVFSKVKGESNHNSDVTITISSSGSDYSKTITVNPLGVISISN